MKKESISFAVSSMMTSVLSMFVVLTMMCVLSFSAYADKGNEPIVPTFTNPAPNDTTPLTIQLVPYVFANGYNVSCFGASDGSIDLTVSGGATPYKYSWSTSSATQDIDSLPASYYSVTVTDANSNSIIGDITLTEPRPFSRIEPSYALFEYPNGYHVSCIGCYNGSIDLSVSGGSGNYTYEWLDGPTTQDRSGLGGMTYTVKISDAHVCSQGENMIVDISLREPPRSDWTMFGNSGSDPQTQFIGNIDNQPLLFKTNNTEQLRIHANGNIGIGTDTPHVKLEVNGSSKINNNLNVGGKFGVGTDSIPTNYMVAVGGNILCAEINVQLVNDWEWPDFVFAEDYEKMTLLELEQFIQKNKHLPNIPSANEIKKNGVNIGETNAMLLQKIEELTLYIIEQNKRIDNLQKEVNLLLNK